MIFGKRLVCLTGILIMVVPATATSNRDQAGQAEPGLEETEPGPNVPAVTSQATLGVSDSNDNSPSCELDPRNMELKGTTPSLMKPEHASNWSEKDIDTIQTQMRAELNRLLAMKPNLCRDKEVPNWNENDVKELSTQMKLKLNRLSLWDNLKRLSALATTQVHYDQEMLRVMMKSVITGMSYRMKLERIMRNKKISASERIKMCRPLMAYLELLNNELAGKTAVGDGDPTEPSRVASAMNWFTTKLGQAVDMLSLSNPKLETHTTPDLTAEQQNAGQGRALFNKDKADKADEETIKKCMSEMQAQMDKLLATATPGQLAQVNIQHPKRKTSGAERLLAAENANGKPLETPVSPDAGSSAPKPSDSREAEDMRKEMETMMRILKPKTKRTRSSSTNQ